MTEKVNVVVRVRPLPGPSSLLATAALDERRVCVANRRVYHADRVFGPKHSSEFIFYDTVVSLIDRFLAGYNATVLAYGQTGSGKTFTMDGITPLVLRYIIENMGGSTSRLSFQFVEIYGESLRDLLTDDPAGSAKHLHLCDGGEDGAVVIVGSSRVKAQNMNEVQEIIDHGTRMRTTGATNMNLHSSRSHSILTVFNHAKQSKLHLVDLAGSERNKKTLNVGQRFRESVAINGGLLALGNVIRALSRNHFQSPEHPRHVPYRSSKLTRFLQDSLGGNSSTLFIACVASDGDNADETTRTLQYGALAMHVLNEPLPSFGDVAGDEAERSLSNHAEENTGEREEALQERVRQLEEKLRRCHEELKLDQKTFANQITEMRRLLDENETLKRRVNFLEGNPTTLLVANSNTVHRNGNANGDSRGQFPVHWSPQEPTPNPSYVASSLELRNMLYPSAQPTQEMNPVPQSQRPQKDLHWEKSTFSSGNVPPAAALGVAAAPRVMTTAAAHSSDREEQLGLIAKEALYYQNSNTELRRKLGVVLSQYEAQSQELAMLRQEVAKIQHLVIP